MVVGQAVALGAGVRAQPITKSHSSAEPIFWSLNRARGVQCQNHRPVRQFAFRNSIRCIYSNVTARRIVGTSTRNADGSEEFPHLHRT
jgi:hypothetical protein